MAGHTSVHGLTKHHRATTPRALGLIHCEVGIADYFLRIAAALIARHNSHARHRADFVMEDGVAGSESIEQPFCDPYGIAGCAQIVDENQELIATKPTDQVGISILSKEITESKGICQAA